MQKIILFLCCLTGSSVLYAQQPDSIRITIAEAEKIFLEKNLLLLAQEYQVDIAKANELQQQLFDNPVFSAEIAAHGSGNKWFDIGRNGQKVFGIDQLVTLAGKRNKRVALAREQSATTSLVLYELLRTLKYELRQDFYTSVYAIDVLQKYDEQVVWLERIIRSYNDQSIKRNVSLKDAVRLKSELIQLNAERNLVINELINARQNLRLLLDTEATVIPVHEEFSGAAPGSLAAMVELAKANRSDLRIAESLARQEELNYALQKALAVPDLTLGAAYDQNGSYVRNYYSLRAAIDLPFFNRNQGNIKSARAQVKAAGAATGYKQSEIEKEVRGSLERWNEAEREYQASRQLFSRDFPEVNKSVLQNFNNGNINLLEFMDFFENYNTVIRQINELQKQRRFAWANLEYTVGARIGN